MGRRLESIDALRGLAVVLMALDHARDFWGSFVVDPEDLATTTPLLFATRWVTHFCAPVFVALAGLGAGLWGRGRSAGERARFLVTRGLLLIALEFTVVHLAWFLTYAGFLNLQVIGAIGLALVVLGALAAVPARWVGALGLAVVLGHGLLDPVDAAELGALGPAWRVLHDGGTFAVGGGWWFQAMYPVLPWIGVACLGYGLTPLFAERGAADRSRLLVRSGALATLAFVVLRASNAYGDPEPWAPGATPVDTLMAFVRCEKYPPSPCFLLMTLGPALVLLGLLERRWGGERAPGATARRLVTLGRAPLFFYVAHLYVLHVTAALGYLWTDGRFLTSMDVFRGPPAWYGHGLGAVYAAWLAVLVVLYPACRWYGDLKRRSRARWLSYL